MQGIDYSSSSSESEDSINDSFSDFPSIIKHSPKSKKKLSEESKRLLGKASECYLTKKYDEAVELGLKLIFQSGPEIIDAYDILIHSYEAMNKLEDSELLKVIKNTLQTSNKEVNWIDSAMKMEQLENFQMAYSCYVRAIKANSNPKELMFLQRARALCALKNNQEGTYLRIMLKKVFAHQIVPQFEDDVVAVAEKCFFSKERGKEKRQEEGINLLRKAFAELRNSKIGSKFVEITNFFGNFIESINFFWNEYLSENTDNDLQYDIRIKIQYLVAWLNYCNDPNYSKEHTLEDEVSFKCYDKEIDLFEEIENINIENRKYYLELGHTLWKFKRYEFLIKLFEKLYSALVTQKLEKEKLSTKIIYPLLINTYKAIGNVRKALEHLQIWKSLSPEASELLEISRIETEIKGPKHYYLFDEVNQEVILKLEDNEEDQNSNQSSPHSPEYSHFALQQPHEEIKISKEKTSEKKRKRKRKKPENIILTHAEEIKIQRLSEAINKWNNYKQELFLQRIPKTQIISKINDSLLKSIFNALNNSKCQEEGEEDKIEEKNQSYSLVLKIIVAILEDFIQAECFDEAYLILQHLESEYLRSQFRIYNLSKNDIENRLLFTYIKLLFVDVLYKLFEKDPFHSNQICDLINSILLELFDNSQNRMLYFKLIINFLDQNIYHIPNQIIRNLARKKHEDPSIRYLVNFLQARRYFQTTFYDKSILKLEKILDVEMKGIEIAHIYLDLGIVHIQNSKPRTRSFQAKKDYILKGFQYFKSYYHLRLITFPAEANYNLARAYHHLAYYSDALHYYNEVVRIITQRNLNKKKISSLAENKDKFLELKSTIDLEDIYLKRSIFNMAMIHKSIGNLHKAQQLLFHYLNIK